MTILERTKLGTDPVRGWMYYDLHFACSYVFAERLLVGNYRSCIARAEDVQAAGLGDWARKMKAQDYHEIYTHAFVSMWSVFETGVENMVATYLKNDVEVAKTAHAQLPRRPRAEYPLATWPWTGEARLIIANALERKAAAVKVNGSGLFGRLKTRLGWLEVHVEDKPDITAALAEANQVRNIILHRYGEVAESDVAAIPSLRPWIGNVIPMNADRFRMYQTAISEMLIAVMKAVSESRHHLPEKRG